MTAWAKSLGAPERWLNSFRKWYSWLALELQFVIYLRLEISKKYQWKKELNKAFQIHWNIFPKLWLIFCCHQQKMQKMSHFWHCNDHNTRNKYDNNFFFFETIFFIYSELYPLYISFLHLQTFKIQFHGVPLHYVLVCKTHFNVPEMTLNPST